MGIFSKFFGALKKTKEAISKKISQIFVGELDDDFYEELEFILVSSDTSTFMLPSPPSVILYP